ncbi:replication protein [Xenorhabdus sp. BG5]|uniref:replication protein n=1 Tax=Xenorhabdus sp. BG5 TaxID=2782014 RepID=UPI00187FD48D|nr:replication protein [Xenorhabdus sp. BG5]MBE8597878.1 replication protein [Xenorhabdus sp. BG5]
MGNVARMADYRPRPEVVERKVADVEDGYTRIANELLESIASSDLTARQLKVMLAIIRKTYGFGKKSDRIADSQVAKITGLSRQNVNKAKNELISMRFLIIDDNKIGVNKVTTEWINQSRDTVSNLKTKNVSNLETDDVSNVETHKRNTVKKKEKNPLTPTGGDDEVVKPKKRKPSSQINYDEYLNAYNEEVGERLPHAVEANTKRQRALKKLIPKLRTPNVDGFRSYVRAFIGMARPFYFGENDRGWTANIDYLLREDTLTGVREGKFVGKDYE